MLRQEGPVEALSVASISDAPFEIEIPNTPGDKRPEDKCGVFGIWAPGGPVLQKTITGMEGLQHRGHSGAGIAYVLENVDLVNGNKEKPVMVHKGRGRVSQAMPDIYRPRGDVRGFDLDIYNDLVGSPVAIGHTRYSTAESEEWDAIQPIRGLAHNGNVDNMPEVAAQFGVDVSEARSDSAMIAEVLHAVAEQLGSMESAMHAVLPHMNGAYCLTMIDKGRLIAAMDPWGYHPLALGKLSDSNGYVVSSEAVVLPEVGAEFIRDVVPGEILVIDDNGINSSRIDREVESQLCAFEGIYTAREDGIVAGIAVRQMRYNLGYHLGEDQPVDADIVVPVPATGIPSAEGYAEATGLPLVLAIEKTKGAPRTFQMRAASRAEAIANSYVFHPELLRGKRVVLDDDSLIKGNTHKALVQAVRDAGATEVHLRLSSAQYRAPCLMGMDTHDKSRLIASYMSDAEIAQYVGADSVAFNTPERVQQAADAAQIRPVAGPKAGKLCMSCVTGEYPFPLPGASREPVMLGMPAIGRKVLAGAGVATL